MKKIFFLVLFLTSFDSFSQTLNQKKADTAVSAIGKNKAYDLILDYEVPQSPAFSILDAVPQQVTKGGAAKPVVFNAFSNFLQTGRLDPGVAVDFSPYMLLGGGFQNLNDYYQHPVKRILANLILSAAVIKNSKDSSNSDIGIGFRINIFDSHDLFQKKNVETIDAIGKILQDNANASHEGGGVPEDEESIVEISNLKDFYETAYTKLNKEKGWALSLGGAYRTTAKSSVLVSDSLINRKSRLWLSSTYYTAKGYNVYGTLQGSFAKDSVPVWIAGLAVGSTNKSNNLGAELVYDFRNKEWNYGANIEIKILKQFTYVLSIGKRSVTVNGVDVESAFRVISNFRVNLFGNQGKK